MTMMPTLRGKTMRRSAHLIVALAGLCAAACSGGSSTPQSTTPASTSASTSTRTPASTPASTPAAACAKAQLADAAAAAARALGPDNVYTIDDVKCADGWAVTSGLLATTANPGMGAPTSFVFRHDGQFWAVQDKAKVCGTNPTTTTAPADAAIPAELFLSGCAAG
ncbi:hypothetical protein B1R94_14410 [Mycolicibacterium litorale]|nr:hypothetical protein B1R94_14410 [Mycolicibacterium litorale]